MIICGGITNIAATFKAQWSAYYTLSRSPEDAVVQTAACQEGLQAMQLLLESLGVLIRFFGPETHN